MYGPDENVKKTALRTQIFCALLKTEEYKFSTNFGGAITTRFSTRFFWMAVLSVDEWVAGFCELAGSVSDGNVEVPSQWCEVALSALSHVA